MSMGMHLTPQMRQTMQLAPRMIQSMEILQLPIMALQERIQQELQENPVLELKEESDEPGAAVAEPEGADAVPVEEPSNPDAEELVIDVQGDSGEDFDRLDSLNRDWEDIFNEEHRPSRGSLEEEGDKKHDAMQNMASRPQSLQDYLADQIAYLEATPEEERYLRMLLAYIDDNGYLTAKLDEIAASVSPPIPLEELEDSLETLQKLDPPGVAARDLRECLLLQVTPEMPLRDVVRALIQHHLEDIQHNRLPNIQKRTGYDLPTIKSAIEALRHLNPKPGAKFSPDKTSYVVPDILVERQDDGTYSVRLLDDWVPPVFINRRYIELYRDKASDPKAKEYLKRKIQSAQWLLESIEQRRSTLEKVTRAIIEHQKDFLDKGPEHIRPLKMQQIADQVGVHVTTVSRAVDDKWVQTPRGIFSLKRFFGGGKETASGEVESYEKIKMKLQEIVEKEDKANPLSDEDLVAKLEEAGYPIKRRTVTKYRMNMNIPSSRERKDWTLAGEAERAVAVGTAPPPPVEPHPEPEPEVAPIEP
jgi:RNA polymerase sigma-54 factor